MKRRNFIKLSLATYVSLILPSSSKAADVDFSQIGFDSNIYNTNSAQTIMIFMYGGASSLAGNISNIEEIKSKSQSDYDNYFRGITPTENSCWQEAGGTHMEDMMAAGDMTLFRSCYSQVREDANNKAHGSCTVQNQKGSFDEDGGGIVANLAQVLKREGVVDAQTKLPFVTFEGESQFYAQGREVLDSYLKPVGLDENFTNPYKRDIRDWYKYTSQEREIEGYNHSDEDEIPGFDPALDAAMNSMAQEHNTNVKIKSAFDKRGALGDFIDDIALATTPDLGADAYPENSDFAQKIEAAIKIMANNPDTKIITMGTGGLGGWDDHNDARNYVSRTEELFVSLKSAVAHLKAVNKINNINILVFGEFGRNVNLNSAFGWDHGNLQNLYVLGGKGYFNHRGVVGETVVDPTGSINRLYLKPKLGTEEFEPLSIAATLYKIFGITNPEILTDGNGAINL